MKNYLIVTFIILLSLSSFSQVENKTHEFKKIKIQGLITRKVTNDTLPSVIVKFMDSKNKLIKVLYTDFDGMYATSICSGELINDTLLIKTTKEFYKQEILVFKIKSDSILNISMTFDNDKTITKEKFKDYKSQFPICNVIRLFDAEGARDCDCKKKYTYTHYCTGEKKKYQELIDGKEDLSDWLLRPN